MSEALRNALANSDHVAAATAIFDAVRGDYDSDAVHGLYHVGRMTQAELNLPREQVADDPSVNRDETVRVTTRVRLFGRLSR